jgi:site-specific recombinase
VTVSFGLSILFALKSRNTGLKDIKSLSQTLLWAFSQNSTAFFYPVKNIFISDASSENEKEDIKA